MQLSVRVLVLALALLFGGAALAQESRGWIGADVQDVTKAEADKLGWDGPRGAKLKIVAPGSPADRAGLKEGDIIVAIDRTMIDASSEVDTAIAGKPPGSELRLQVLSGGRERRVAVTVAQQPTARPLDTAVIPWLMLDPGGHMALIRGLTFTPDGQQIVSAGEDKIIRVWDWQAGKTVRTIRGQVGDGPEGRIDAMALSRDGRWMAVAGWMDLGTAKLPCCGDIRLYDFVSGKLVAILKGHTSIVLSLAFSPNGKQLISGSADLSVIIWDLAKRAPLHRLPGHTAEIHAVGFMPDGARALTASYDMTLKLWSVKDGQEITTMRGHKDRIYSMAISPVDGTIYSGSDDGEIRVWNGQTGQPVRTLGNINAWAGTLSLNPDGTKLVSTCGGGGGCSGAPQIVWDVASGRRLQQPRHHDNIVLAAGVSPNGRLVATGGGSNRQIQIWDIGNAEVRKTLKGTGSHRWSVGFSPDGRRIAWGSTWRPAPGGPSHTSDATSPLEFALRLPIGSQGVGRPERLDDADAASFLRARRSYGGYSLVHRAGGRFGHDAILELRKDGAMLTSVERDATTGFSHRGYAFTPDGNTIVSAGDGGFITAYDLNMRKLGDFVGHNGDVWAITPSPDGRLLVSGSGDQTVRLWNLKTRELIVSLFHGYDGEWVMWTPQGYYMGSPGADKLVGWQINKGPAQEADYVGADQLREHLNRPDIIEKAIVLASAERAVRESPGTSFKLADLLARPVPRFKIVSPAPGPAGPVRRVTLRIAIEATPDPVRLIRVQVNGRQVGEQTPGIGTGGFGAGERTLEVPLGKGRNEIRVALTNTIGEKAETLVLDLEAQGDLDARGVLHILAIGVNDYKGLSNWCGKPNCDLRFPVNDAARFADAVEKRMGPDHIHVNKRVLINGGDPKDAPTSSNIIDAVEVLRNARETDTIVLFIAGHGTNDGPDYRFLPTNAEKTESGLRGSTVVPWQVLQGAIEAAKGRRLLFVDTCHSGGAYHQRLGNSSYHANIVAYTAARFDQEALEDAGLKHGLFTYAVVEGLEGKGGLSTKRQLTTKDLADYIVQRVGKLAKEMQGDQEPQYFKGRDAEDFVLARW